MFKHPAAPAPNATKVIPTIALNVSILECDVIYPTAQVNITKDMTLGFNNNNNDCKNEVVLMPVDDFIFTVLLDTFNQR